MKIQDNRKHRASVRYVVIKRISSIMCLFHGFCDVNKHTRRLCTARHLAKSDRIRKEVQQKNSGMTNK